jgi:hypothetical protein
VVFTCYSIHLLTLLLSFRPRHGVADELYRGRLRMRPPDALAVFWIVPLTVIGFSRPGRTGWYCLTIITAYAGVILVTGAGGMLTRAAIFTLAMGICFSVYILLTDELNANG